MKGQTALLASCERLHLSFAGRAQHAHDGIHLAPAGVSLKEGPARHHLATDAAARPPVDAGAIPQGLGA